MRARGTSGARPPEPADRELWRRGQEVETIPDEAEYLLDLAAFADNRLDDDEAARIATLIARDPRAADDVAAARALAGAETMPAGAQIVARAAALIGEDRREGVLIAFPRRPSVARPWYSAATWSGLAAAMVLAGWLGFDLGSGISNSATFSRSGDDAAATELLDTAPLLPRDFTENSQI